MRNGNYLTVRKSASAVAGLLACALALEAWLVPVGIMPELPARAQTASAYSLDYSTFLGGSLFDRTAGDQVTDAQGNLYVAGNTLSPNFPATPGAFDTTFNDTSGASDAFVAKFSPSGQLLWSTYLGGPNRDELYGIEVDPLGYVYVAGAFGPNAPTTPGVIQPGFAGGSGIYPWDGYLAKIKPDGSGLVWASYLGAAGTANDALRTMAIDASGHVIVGTGYQGSPWPGAWFANGYQSVPQGGIDTVVIKVRSDGAQVLWASYIGGSRDDSAQPGLAVDAQGNVHVLLTTNSLNMPATAGAYDATQNGMDDAYIAKLSADGRTLLYGTYLGSPDNDGTGGKSPITVDRQGNALVSIWTRSSNFPTTAGAAHAAPVEFTSWGTTSIVAKLSSTGALSASSYMGYNGGAEDVDFDAEGNVYTVGETMRTNLPVTPDAYQRTLAGGTDAYAEVLSSDLSRVVYATYLGGRGLDHARMTWVDRIHGAFYVFGGTNSADFPVKNAWQSTNRGGEDIFVTKFMIGTGPTTQAPSVSENGVLNAASFAAAGQPGHAVAPGSLVSIFGSQLASGQVVAGTAPLSPSLSGVTVTIGSMQAPIQFVSPGQINAQLPWNLLAPNAETGGAALVVNRQGALSAPRNVQLARVSPGIYTLPGTGIGPAVVVNSSDGSVAQPPGSVPGAVSRPARPGEAIIIYANGLGPVDRPIADGAASLDALRRTLVVPIVLIGNREAEVLFSGLAPQFPGVNQVNVVVPQGVQAGGSVPLQLRVAGITTSDQVTIAVGN